MDMETLLAEKLVSLVEQKVDEQQEQQPKPEPIKGYLKQKEMADYLSISVTTFRENIMPLAPPTVVVDGLVRYPVEEFDKWLKGKYLIWDDEYAPAKTRA